MYAVKKRVHHMRRVFNLTYCVMRILCVKVIVATVMKRVLGCQRHRSQQNALRFWIEGEPNTRAHSRCLY